MDKVSLIRIRCMDKMDKGSVDNDEADKNKVDKKKLD